MQVSTRIGDSRMTPVERFFPRSHGQDQLLVHLSAALGSGLRSHALRAQVVDGLDGIAVHRGSLGKELVANLVPAGATPVLGSLPEIGPVTYHDCRAFVSLASDTVPAATHLLVIDQANGKQALLGREALGRNIQLNTVPEGLHVIWPRQPEVQPFCAVLEELRFECEVEERWDQEVLVRAVGGSVPDAVIGEEELGFDPKSFWHLGEGYGEPGDRFIWSMKRFEDGRQTSLIEALPRRESVVPPGTADKDIDLAEFADEWAAWAQAG